jgi:hypothetical protein
MILEQNVCRRSWKWKSEIRARTAILELGEELKISTVRGVNEEYSSARRAGEKISLSTFFQVKEMRVEGEIQQLPVIGTWWSPGRNTFYVAVEKTMDAPDHQPATTLMSSSLAGEPGREESGVDLLNIEGKETFVSLLRVSSALCQNTSKEP